jgi:hypothetical protein
MINIFESNQILTAVNSKINEQKLMIKEDQRVLDMLMIENHDIYGK